MNVFKRMIKYHKTEMKDEVVNKFIPKPITIFGLCNEVNNQVRAYELSSK